MSKFKLAIIGIFGLLIIGGVIMFSSYRGNSGEQVTITIWGTMPQDYFDNAIKKTSLYQNKQIAVQYVNKSSENFDSEFIEALASGKGPDIFMLPSDKILTHRNKIFPLPYTVFTERQFKDSFIEGSEIYMSKEGILGFPFVVDPLVMYWNRDIFNQVKLTEPPSYWDEFYSLANLISKKDGALNIQRSAVAFGEFSNIKNAKEILINLAMQAGTPVVVWDNGFPRSVFDYSYNKPVMPAEAAVNFYTEFSNSAKNSYSWNRSLPNSTNSFIAGDLAIYFGFGSEIASLQIKNPNLNFDVADVPVSREGGVQVSYGRFNSFAITKASKNVNTAFNVISILTEREAASVFSQSLRLPPVRRDLLKIKQTDAYLSVFYDSAIRSRAWLDPSPARSDSVFKNMIESITSGRSRTIEAIGKANKELADLLSK